MNFEGFKPQPIPRFGSLVQSDDTTELPFGIAEQLENCTFRAQSVGPRDGKAIKLKFGDRDSSIGGFGVMRYLAPDNSGQENIQIVAGTQADGNVWGASPFLQSSVRQLTTDSMLAASGLTRGANIGLSPQFCQAFNKMLIAQGNLMTGVSTPLIVDGATLTCDPISDKPFGDAWLPNTMYRIGQVVSPTNVGSSNLYYCTQTGRTSSSEPVWPLTTLGTVVDGGGSGNVIWRKLEIACTSGLEAPAAPVQTGSIAGVAVPAGGTLFLVCTWTNQYGESSANVVNPDGTAGNLLQWKNVSGSAVNLQILLPPIPADIAVLAPQYAITACNVYGYVVAGTPDPAFYLDQTSYAFIGTGAAASAFTVSTVGTGRQLPLVNNAYTSPAGNVSSGVRYMIVLYQTRTGYICGFSGPAPIRCEVSVDGRQMLVQNLPRGPYNCVARICAFTVAGQGSGGPYFYINEDDYVDPGLGSAKIKQTATKIPDNITTSAYFDFLDSYLPGGSEVTDYFDRIEVPPCSDIAFSKSLNRVAYAGVEGYPSAILISDLEDAEALRVPGSIVQLSQTDGDRAVCMRDLGTIHVGYKENSAHSIVPNDGDPQDWGADELWTGSAPCNPRAIDVAQGEEQKFHAYAHRTGGYVWQGGKGGPTLLVKELIGTAEDPGIWDRINWSHSHLICTTIDMKNRMIYFHVPLDGATTNDTRITVNYMNGFDEPIIFIVRTGREVPNISGRKWSIDNIAANDCKYVPQRTSGN